MQTLIAQLHATRCAGIIRQGEDTRTFHRRGIIDLFELYENEPDFLRGALLADKVIGKGAAALCVLGGVSGVYADVISTPALALLEEAGIKVTYGAQASRIMNRTQDGLCPVEQRCLTLTSPHEMYIQIKNFLQQ